MDLDHEGRREERLATADAQQAELLAGSLSRTPETQEQRKLQAAACVMAVRLRSDQCPSSSTGTVTGQSGRLATCRNPSNSGREVGRRIRSRRAGVKKRNCQLCTPPRSDLRTSVKAQLAPPTFTIRCALSGIGRSFDLAAGEASIS
ncbi:hypothetical protein [Micromonospora musae]|uniref:hypothetical protein n=1 Tax=Micromonospora musae TaxID=1894970 RepID=UPI0033E6152D